ncbi:hypothetical protein QCD60_14540 [Pokkaliibacter sp. MBI-7]|uniref:hypothetical protein n=1 Tax=Pokkaliibacter sp. MBI-7 TaxID=3040600 RepID=UPI00244977C5|nr:hypothetical protein [Pokkaliibacter sp. MBI-7]MDH2433788.1 hypothetical protein [Pokkaliibacter sp. MBI-7]
MLSYEDKKWNELIGGYKTLYNPVSALKMLERDPASKKAWDELWNELHHQGDVGSASYAAIPELVRIHQEVQFPASNFYSLASTIEIERHRKSNPLLPEWLEPSYFSAWCIILDLALKDVREARDQLSVHAILGALAIAKGALKLGALISYSDETEIEEQLNEAIAWSEIYR